MTNVGFGETEHTKDQDSQDEKKHKNQNLTFVIMAKQGLDTLYEEFMVG